LKPIYKLLLVLLCLFLGLNGAVAQQLDPGFPPFGSFQGGSFDTINLANINIHFAIPIVNKAGRGCGNLTNDQYDQWRRENPTQTVTASGDIYQKNDDGSTTKVGHETYYNDNHSNRDNDVGFNTLIGLLTMPLHYIGHAQDLFTGPPTVCVGQRCANTWDVAGLQRLHSVETIMQSNKASYDYWNQKSTQEIIDSLAPGATQPLTLYPNGNVADGNTRILILQERGVDVNSLPSVTRVPDFVDPLGPIE
jgi:hypothetical protein